MIDLNSLDDRPLRAILPRDDESMNPHSSRPRGEREYPPHGAKLTIGRELSNDEIVIECGGWELLICGEDREGDR